MGELSTLRATKTVSLTLSHLLFFGVFGMGEYYVYTYNSECRVSGFSVWRIDYATMVVGYLVCVFPALMVKSNHRAHTLIAKSLALFLVVVLNVHLRSRYFNCFYFGGARKEVLAAPMLNVLLLSLCLAVEYSMLVGSWISELVKFGSRRRGWRDDPIAG